MMKTCPFCAEEIKDAAVVCKHCGRELKAPAKAKKKGGWGSAIVALCAIILLVCLLVYALSGGRDTSTPSTYTVKYQVAGTTSEASLTYDNRGGNVEQHDVSVP